MLTLTLGAASPVLAAAAQAQTELAPATNATGTVQLYCRLRWTATKIWVQVYNTGTEAAEPGMVFKYKTLGPKGAEGTYVLDKRLAPERRRSVAKAFEHGDLWGCEPKLPKK